MPVQKLRLMRGWSQQQLADLSGLSARTIQRIESGMPASAESLKSLAAVFEVHFSTLTQELNMTDPVTPDTFALKQEVAAFKYVRGVRAFYIHLFQMVPVWLLLVAVNYWVSPHRLWAPWVVLFMVLGLLMHAAYVFGNQRLLGPKWELKQVEKRLGKPLA